MIHDYEFLKSLTDLKVDLRILLTIPFAVASCERSCNKLKKKKLRAIYVPHYVTKECILSIEKFICNSINFDDVISDFASLKTRKIKL